VRSSLANCHVDPLQNTVEMNQYMSCVHEWGHVAAKFSLCDMPVSSKKDMLWEQNVPENIFSQPHVA